MITKFKRPTRIAGILAFTLVVFLSGVTLTEANSDAIEVEQTLNNMLVALNEQDFDRWAEFYVQDQTFSTVVLRGVTIHGFANYKEYLKFWYEQASIENHVYTNIDVHVSGDVAWATLRDQSIIRYTNETTPERIIDGLGIVGLVKQNGRWLIKHYSVNDQADTLRSVVQTQFVKTSDGAAGMPVSEFRFASGLTPAPDGVGQKQSGSFQISGGSGSGISGQTRPFASLMPTYPEYAKDNGISGEVKLQATIDEAGQIVAVIEKGVHPVLDEAAVKAVEQWEFNNNSAPFVADITITFNPNGTVATRISTRKP